jgi:hypothetical protein
VSYQVLPDLAPDEYDALKADIAARGVMVPVEVDENGEMLDGHHRLRAASEVGADVPKVVRSGMSDEEKVAHVLALNLARRHLTREQRQQLVVSLRERGWTFERIAETVGVGIGTAWRDVPNGKRAPHTAEMSVTITELRAALKPLREMTRQDPAVFAAAVDPYHRRGMAKRLRELGTYLGHIALKLEEMA